jgi:hypothetical protein
MTGIGMHGRLLGTISTTVLVLLVGCAGTIKEFYPDSFFSEDNIYQNKPIGFTLTFRGQWHIFTDPNEMQGRLRGFAEELQEQGGELLFVGSTVERTQGVRGIAANLNAPAREYAERIRDINTVAVDSGLTEMLVANVPMVRWDYYDTGFRFVEFFFRIETYDVRVAFWTKPELFDAFEPVYLSIMSSISRTSRW